MGFEEPEVRLALRKCHNDKMAAAEFLLRGDAAKFMTGGAEDVMPSSSGMPGSGGSGSGRGGASTGGSARTGAAAAPSGLSYEEARAISRAAGGNPELARVQHMSQFDHLGPGRDPVRGKHKRDTVRMQTRCPCGGADNV